MPVLNVLAEAYAARGLTVWAINFGEAKSAYESFVGDHDYPHLFWGRDSSGDIARTYGVRGIPVTYIIDGEGIIRYAHVGFGSQMERTLASEIESLLD